MKKILFILGLFILVLAPFNGAKAQMCDTDAQQCDINYNPANPSNPAPYDNTQNPTAPSQGGGTNPQQPPQQGGTPIIVSPSQQTIGNQQQQQPQDPGFGLCMSITTKAQFDACCDMNNPSDACNQYYASAQYNKCLLNPNDPACTVPGQIGVAQNTNPMNSDPGSNNTSNVGSPSGSSAEVAGCSNIKFKSLLDILIWIKCIIGAVIIPLIFALAFLFFLWGVFKFMQATDTTMKEEAKKFIFWGLLGLFVMVGVWGIIKIAGDTLGVDTKGIPYLQTKYLDPKNKTP